MRFFSTFITGFGEVVKSEIPKVLKNIRLELLTDGLIIYQTTSSGYGGNSAAPERSAGAKRRRSVVGIGLVKSSDFIQETQQFDLLRKTQLRSLPTALRFIDIYLYQKSNFLSDRRESKDV